MTIQIRFLSIVLRKASLSRLEDRDTTAVEALFSWVPEWRCEDGRLLATAFMAPVDVRKFGGALEHLGLSRQRDWVVVDEGTGPTEPAHWLEFVGGLGSTVISAAREAGDDDRTLIWEPVRMPYPNATLTLTGRIQKRFGMDCGHDPEGHRQDFGRYLPAWGGRDLYLVEHGPGQDMTGQERPGGYLSMQSYPAEFQDIVQQARAQA